MKQQERPPSEFINYIGDLIRERERKSLPTFYTICIEQYEKITPVAEKEEGYENFKQEVMKYMSDYNLTALIVQLFSAKAKNVKTPFQTFKVPLKKTTPTVFLSGFDKETSINQAVQIESSVPVGKYYDEKFELQMRIMRNELEKQTLNERLIQLTERYEEKLKEQDKSYGEKIKTLEQELKDLESEIGELEGEIAKNEKEKHNSFGNIALGSIGTRMIEGFAKSDMGRGVLKGVLGEAGYETLQGHLAGIENEKKNENENSEKSSARIITENKEKTPREIALEFIQKVGESFSDKHLRMLYDIAETSVKHIKDLEVLWETQNHIKFERSRPIGSIVNDSRIKEVEEEKEKEEEGEEKEEDTDKDDLNNIA